MQRHPTLPHDTPSLAKPESEADAGLMLSPRDLCTSRPSPDDFHLCNRFLNEASAGRVRAYAGSKLPRENSLLSTRHRVHPASSVTRCPSPVWEGRWSKRELSTRRADQMQLCSSSTARHVFGRVWRKGQPASLWPLGESLFPCNANYHLSTWRVFLLFLPKTNTPELPPSLPLYNSAWHEMLCKCPSQNQTETGEAFSSIAEPKGSSVSTAKKGWGFATRKKLQTS